MVSTLLEDAKSCEAFKGTVQLAADLKVIPIVPNVEEVTATAVPVSNGTDKKKKTAKGKK